LFLEGSSHLYVRSRQTIPPHKKLIKNGAATSSKDSEKCFQMGVNCSGKTPFSHIIFKPRFIHFANNRQCILSDKKVFIGKHILPIKNSHFIVDVSRFTSGLIDFQ